MDMPTPSLRGLLLVTAPWVLAINTEPPSFSSLAWWEMLQYFLGVAVALFGLYDFFLKIRAKGRQGKNEKQAKEK
jgi:hypothetical protein